MQTVSQSDVGADKRAAHQSRTGKRPVTLPSGVKASVQDGVLTVAGPKGTLSRPIPASVKVQHDGSEVTIVPVDGVEAKEGRKYQGLFRALVKNMVHGAAQGFEASMDLYGVGYKAELNGSQLTLALGLSHQVKFSLPSEVKGKVEIIDEAGQKRPRLILTSSNNEILGQVAAKIKSYRPPEPYKGKGVRFTGERIREKAGKAGGKGKK
jgi:large subunit ribosomal protein L6